MPVGGTGTFARGSDRLAGINGEEIGCERQSNQRGVAMETIRAIAPLSSMGWHPCPLIGPMPAGQDFSTDGQTGHALERKG
jgi:hypothetical protein